MIGPKQFIMPTQDPRQEPLHYGGSNQGSENFHYWCRYKVLFMRLLSGLWLLVGMTKWSFILTAEGRSFELLSLDVQSSLIFFAVFDTLAAVGLWFTSSWGGVLWLCAVATHIGVFTFLGRTPYESISFLLLDVGLVFAYMALSWKVAREEQAES